MGLTKLMKKLLPDIHPDLMAAADACDVADKNFEEVAKRVRKECKHEFVIEAPYRGSDWGSSFSPFRICLVCRREEHAWSFYKGNTIDGGPSEFHGPCELYAEPVAQMERDDLYSLRL